MWCTWKLEILEIDKKGLQNQKNKARHIHMGYSHGIYCQQQVTIGLPKPEKVHVIMRLLSAIPRSSKDLYCIFTLKCLNNTMWPGILCDSIKELTKARISRWNKVGPKTSEKTGTIVLIGVRAFFWRVFQPRNRGKTNSRYISI